VHPFCRVPSFASTTLPFVGDVNSRALIQAIYKWYRFLSPQIDLQIESTVFDQRTNRLYLSINQTFSIWFLPFHRSPVRLVTVLHLVPDHSQQVTSKSNNHHQLEARPIGTAPTEPSFADVASPLTNTATAVEKATKAHTTTTNHIQAESSGASTPSPRRYLIQKQEDLYQVNEFLKFVLLSPGAALYGWFQLCGAMACLMGVLFVGPMMGALGLWSDRSVGVGKGKGKGKGHGGEEQAEQMVHGGADEKKEEGDGLEGEKSG
jgi:hypothetical protein